MPRPRKYRTNADRQRAYRRRKKRPAYLQSKSEMWETPPDLFAELNREFKFTCDVAASPENAKCDAFFTAEQDGLKQKWEGVCWCNPPYGPQIGNWIRKAHESSLNGATVVFLIPSRTDTKWFHEYVQPFAEIRFLPGRLKFGDSETPAPFPSMLAIFHPTQSRIAHSERWLGKRALRSRHRFGSRLTST